MTLIVGFVNKKIAVIAADTQISSYNGAQEIINRAVIHKIDLVDHNLLFSYLGKWDILNEDKLSEFRKKLTNRKNKVFFAFRFVRRLNRDALLIGFWNFGLIWRLVFKGRKESKIKKLVIKKGSFYFNDPNSNLLNYVTVESRIKSYLDDTSTALENYLFAINNTILSEIVQGKDLVIPGLVLNNNRNTVGGYVTICILLKETKYTLRIFNKTRAHCFFKHYQNGNLLDNNSNPFGLGLNHSQIIYIDNLAMIFKSINDSENDAIKSSLLILLQNQINHLRENDFLHCFLLRQLVIYMNKNANLNLNIVTCNEEFIFADDNDLEIDFCKTFFD